MDESINDMLVTLTRLKSNDKTYTMGERFYVIVDGASSDFYVDGVSHPHAVYSFIGPGALAPVDEKPETGPFFQCREDTKAGDVHVVDSLNRPMNGTVSLRLSWGGKERKVAVECRSDREFAVDSSFEADHVVVITEKLVVDKKFGDRVEIALVELKTARMFRPNSEVHVRVADGVTLAWGNADDEGVIDLSIAKPLPRILYGTVSLQFVDGQSGEVIDVRDGTFRVKYYIRVLKR